MPEAFKRAVQRGMRDALDPLCRFREVSVLCYHSISDDPHNLTINVKMFKAHLDFLANAGYAFVSLGDIVEWMNGARTLPHKAVAITFDDGYADFESAALPLLNAHQAPAAVFVVERNLDESDCINREGLTRLRERGVEVGFHTYTHPNLAALSGSELIREVRPLSFERFFAYPGGRYSREATQAVKPAGYVAAFSTKPTLVHKTSDRHALPRNVVSKNMQLWEVRFRATKALDWYRALWRLFAWLAFVPTARKIKQLKAEQKRREQKQSVANSLIKWRARRDSNS